MQIRPGRTSIVYMPIVAQRLGDINVTVLAKTQVAKDVVTRKLHVEVSCLRRRSSGKNTRKNRISLIPIVADPHPPQLA